MTRYTTSWTDWRLIVGSPNGISPYAVKPATGATITPKEKAVTNIIICGGRDFGHRITSNGGVDGAWHSDCWVLMHKKLCGLFCFKEGPMYKEPVLFCGMAKGADEMAHEWAGDHPEWGIREFPAEWDKYGTGAGPIRNKAMIDAGANIVIAFWDGLSRGTKDMINQGLARGLEVHVFRYEPLRT